MAKKRESASTRNINAATRKDLKDLGLSREDACSIVRHQPYAAWHELRMVQGVTDEVEATLRAAGYAIERIAAPSSEPAAHELAVFRLKGWRWTRDAHRFTWAYRAWLNTMDRLIADRQTVVNALGQVADGQTTPAAVAAAMEQVAQAREKLADVLARRQQATMMFLSQALPLFSGSSFGGSGSGPGPSPGSTGSASGLTGLNSDEWWVYLHYPLYGIDAVECAMEAQDVSAAEYPGHTSNDAGNAFKHAFWNCWMVEQMGYVSMAKRFADAHETGDTTQPKIEADMDFHNNHVGRNLGDNPDAELGRHPDGGSWSSRPCRERVKEALRQGKLVKVGTGPGGVPALVPTP